MLKTVTIDFNCICFYTMELLLAFFILLGLQPFEDEYMASKRSFLSEQSL